MLIISLRRSVTKEMTNHEIAQLLKDVAAAYSIKDEEKYRFQILAYQRAADTIDHLTVELQILYKRNELESVPGVGSSIKSHLEELFKTGKVKHFEDILKDTPKSVFVLMKVPNFGPKTSYKLVKAFSLENEKTVINDLEKIAKAGRIAKLEGFGEKSQEDILNTLVEYKKGKEKKSRMVLPYAGEIAERIVGYLREIPHTVTASPLGSLRRRASTVGDIDIAVATNKPKKVIEHFIAYPHKERVVEKGSTTASILVSGGKQVDLMTQPPQSFGSLLQHLTGSKNHNVHLREYALKKGLSLSEYGIKKRINDKQKLIKYDTEEKFYNAVGIDWIPPEIREDKGEIELAAKHKLPNLVNLSEIKGDLHLHSNFPIEPSHDMGQNSMKEMIKKATGLGYEYLGFSEHNPSVSQHANDDVYSILSKKKYKIEQLNSGNKSIHIFNLLEVDILVNGKLAIDNKSVELLDAMIVSIHSVFSMNAKEMTKRVISGLSHPKAKVLAHPTGRILNVRPGYELIWDDIFDFCLKNNKALEINASPTRLDLPDTLVKEAVKHGVKIVINTDSHAASQMKLMEYGVSVARRGWAQSDDILNTLGYNKFREWILQ